MLSTVKTPYMILYTMICIIISTLISKIINQSDFAAGIGGTLLGVGVLGCLVAFYDNFNVVIFATCLYMIITGITYIIDYAERKKSASKSNMRSYTICFVIFFSAIFYIVLEMLSDKTNPIIIMIVSAIGLVALILGIYFAIDNV